MGLVTPERLSSKVSDRLTQSSRLSSISDLLMMCLGDYVTCEAALFITGESAGFFCPTGFSEDQLAQLRKRFINLSSPSHERIPASGCPPETLQFADGSFVFLIPLIHNNAIRAVLCLQGENTEDFEPVRRQLTSLYPIFHLAAVAIVHAHGEQEQTRALGDCSTGMPLQNGNAMSQVMAGLLRNVSHHIRTPITAVRGYAKMMLEGRTGPLSDSQRDCLRMALQGSEQLAETAASISRASELVDQLHPEVLDGRILWLAVLSDSLPQLIGKNITVDKNIPLEGGAICADRKVIVDAFERLLSYATRIVESQGTLQVDLRCNNDFTLKITVPGLGPWPDTKMEMCALQEIVFLHGGKVFSTISKDRDLSFTLTLPGYAG